MKTQRKTVKFKKYLEPYISSTSRRGKHDFKELRDFIQGKTQKRSRAGLKPISSNKSLKSTKVKSILNRKITKYAEEPKRFDKYSRKSDFSRPSSVTSLFTTCSIGNNAFSQKYETLQEGGSCREESFKPKVSDVTSMNQIKFEPQIAKDCFRREIVECIEDNLVISDKRTSERLKLRNRSISRDVDMQNMTLISEIQSDLERSQDMSVDDISMGSSPTQFHESPSTKFYIGKQIKNFAKTTSFALPRKCTRQSTMTPEVSAQNINFKKTLSTQNAVLKYTRNKRELNKDSRSFKCYAESDVVDFTKTKPIKTRYNLTKGDDDEDSDSEDIKNGQKFLILHLEKAIMGLLKA